MLIKFSKDLLLPPTTTSKYRLLELPPDGELLEGLTSNKDGNVKFKGLFEDEAVLCTDKVTFRVREVHTSNLHLLVMNEVVEQVTLNLLEVQAIPGRIERLQELLLACPFNGPDETPNQVHLEKLDHDKIFGDVQASDKEIQEALKEYEAILIDGYYRIIGAEYLCQFFRNLLSTLTLNDWSPTEIIPKEELLEQLCKDDGMEQFPPNIARHILKVYGHDEENNGGWRVNQVKVCRFYAQELLKAKPVWLQGELLLAWESLTGGDIKPSISMLVGLALIDPIPGDLDLRVTYFPTLNLPLEPIPLFVRLFEVRQRWNLHCIEPYVEHSAKVLGVKTLDLIVKHARISLDPITSTRIVTPLFPI